MLLNCQPAEVFLQVSTLVLLLSDESFKGFEWMSLNAPQTAVCLCDSYNNSDYNCGFVTVCCDVRCAGVELFALWWHQFAPLPFLDLPICPSLGALCPSLWGFGPPPWPLTCGCPGLNCPAGPGWRGGPLGGMSSGIPEAPYMAERRLFSTRR